MEKIYKVCSTCRGKGVIPVMLGSKRITRPCTACDGKGKISVDRRKIP